MQRLRYSTARREGASQGTLVIDATTPDVIAFPKEKRQTFYGFSEVVFKQLKNYPGIEKVQVNYHIGPHLTFGGGLSVAAR